MFLIETFCKETISLYNKLSLDFLFHFVESLWITIFKSLLIIKVSITLFIFDIFSIEYKRDISSDFENAVFTSGAVNSIFDITFCLTAFIW